MAGAEALRLTGGAASAGDGGGAGGTGGTGDVGIGRSAGNPRITGLVLAGGRGQRMGGVDKGLQPLQGRPLVQHVLQRLAPQVDRVWISANRHLPRYQALGLPVLPDTLPDHPGPLAGLLAGLLANAADRCPSDWLLTVPCDSPRLPHDLAARLWAAAQAQAADVALALTRAPAVPQPVSAADPAADLAADLATDLAIDLASDPTKVPEMRPATHPATHPATAGAAGPAAAVCGAAPAVLPQDDGGEGLACRVDGVGGLGDLGDVGDLGDLGAAAATAGVPPAQADALLAQALARTPDPRWQLHPVFALVRSSCLDDLQQQLAQGQRRVLRWMQQQPVALVLFDDPQAFANLNTLDDLQRWGLPR